MQKSVRINKDTYNQLDHLRNALYPFPISFPKIIQIATDNLNREVITNGKKALKEKSTR